MVILFDQFNLPDDVFSIIFATKQQVIVARLLVEEMKMHQNELTKTEMSMFATKLHEGVEVEGTVGKDIKVRKKIEISYNKRQFYDRILTPMRTMGLIDYDMYSKTYKLSDKFNKNMMKIGLMWLQELRKPPKGLVIKEKK